MDDTTRQRIQRLKDALAYYAWEKHRKWGGLSPELKEAGDQMTIVATMALDFDCDTYPSVEVEAAPCKECRGTGTLRMPVANVETRESTVAKIPCMRCHGRGYLRSRESCLTCGGEGALVGDDGRKHMCPPCEGSGRRP